MNNFIKVGDDQYLDLNKVVAFYVTYENDEVLCRVHIRTMDGKEHSLALNARAVRQWLKSAVRFDFTKAI